MYRVFVLVLLSVFTDFTLADEPFDFKGIKLGASEEEFIEKIYAQGYSGSRLKCSTQSPLNNAKGDRVCKSKGNDVKIAFARTQILDPTIYFIDDKLVYLSFNIDSGMFQRVVDALVQKYGQPQHSGTIQGPLLPSITHSWQRSGSKISAFQHSGVIYYSHFIYSLESYLPTVEQREKKIAQELAKDL